MRSKKDNKLYTGWTDRLEERVLKHNNGSVKATKGRLSLELVYYEACLDRKLAVKREKQLNTGFGRAYLKRRI